MFNTARIIVQQECMRYGILEVRLLNGERTKTLALCRSECVRRMRKETTLSWAEIALMVGRKRGFRGDRKKLSNS